jgi:hypothetical protein
VLFAPFHNVAVCNVHSASPDAAWRKEDTKIYKFSKAYSVKIERMADHLFWVHYPAYPSDHLRPGALHVWKAKTAACAEMQWMFRFGRVVREMMANHTREIRGDIAKLTRNYYLRCGDLTNGNPDIPIPRDLCISSMNAFGGVLEMGRWGRSSACVVASTARKAGRRAGNEKATGTGAGAGPGSGSGSGKGTNRTQGFAIPTVPRLGIGELQYGTDGPLDMPLDVPLDDPLSMRLDVPLDDPLGVRLDVPLDGPPDMPSDGPLDDPKDGSSNGTGHAGSKPRRKVAKTKRQENNDGRFKRPKSNKPMDEPLMPICDSLAEMAFVAKPEPVQSTSAPTEDVWTKMLEGCVDDSAKLNLYLQSLLRNA